MPRASYFQDVGNPIQVDRLPSRPARFALAYTGDDEAHISTRCWNTLVLIIGISALDLAIRRYGTSIVALWHAGLLLVCMGLVAIGREKLTSQLTIGVLYPPLAAVVTGMPSVLLILGGIGLAFYVRLLLQHWIEVSTAGTLTKQRREKLLQEWDGFTRVACRTLVGFGVLAWMTNEPLLLPILTAAFMVAVALSSGKAASPVLLIDVLRSWIGYNQRNVVRSGIVQSPSGATTYRNVLTIACATLMSAALRSTSPVTDEFSWLLAATPILLTLAVPLCCFPVIAAASGFRKAGISSSNWSGVTSELRNSVNPIERDSFFMARVVADGSPVIVPRKVFGEHAHFLGDSGSGKTSLGLGPWMEQAIAHGDCSVVVLDLKADSLELFATLEASRKELRERTGVSLPLKFFSNQDDLATFGFNPLTQPFWKNFNAYVRTDILCSATGLDYGTDYGAGFYSSSNSGVVYETLRSFPEIRSFRDMSERCGFVLRDNRSDLHAEIRKAGVHVHEVLKRLAAFEALNATAGSSQKQVVENGIDLTQPFREPSLHYFHLSSTLTPGSAPAIARLVTYMLLAASTQTDRNVPVYLVIDEFQRMVAQNLDYLLQLARSMGVGVILANQNMQDLKTMKSDLIPAIESNCRYRQWFSISGLEDQQRLSALAGESVELFHTWSESTSGNGTTASHSVAQHLVPRMATNDIALASDHTFQSVLRISRGAGYAQFGGLPVIVESNYHISGEEYGRRKAMAWPMETPGTFVPRELNQASPAGIPISVGPVISTEVVGGTGVTGGGNFDSFLQQHNARRKRRNDSD